MTLEGIVLLIGVGLIIGGFCTAGIPSAVLFIVGGGCVGWFIGIVHAVSATFSR